MDVCDLFCGKAFLGNTIGLMDDDDAKFTDDQPFGESLQATPNLRKDHLRR